MRRQAVKLGRGWSAGDRSGSSSEVFPARVPGAVQTDLARLGKIPDPYRGEGHRAALRLAERDWAYRLDFASPFGGDYPHLDLVFEGLDPFARVFLNEAEVLEAQNAFRSYRVPVAGRLRPGENRFEVWIDSPLKQGRELERRWGRYPAAIGDPARVFVRKGAYQFGWDFAPPIVPLGIFRPVRLEAYHGRIAELWPRARLEEAAIEVVLQSQGAGDRFEVLLFSPEGALLARAEAAAGSARVRLPVVRPRLWWPLGLGPRPRYRVVARLYQGATLLDELERRVAFRDLRLRRKPPQSGEEHFYFEAGGVPFFAGGANWVPLDPFPHRFTRARYHRRLAAAAWAGVRLLRVWGGGVYETEDFYDLADRLGILIWQDFMFACAAYPETPEFLAEVEAEAREQVRRLRHHPSLLLWCGNNEDYLDAPRLGARPARKIYEGLLPRVVREEDPDRPYHPGSPYGGDRHVWEVWHGGARIEDYPRFAAPFVSEFGLLSWPSRALEARYHPKPLLWDRGAREKLQPYLEAAFGAVPEDPEALRYATWWLQAEAVRSAFFWRTFGPRRVGGALVWQFADTWPAASWALLDYTDRPKPALYVLRRLIAPRALFLRRGAGEVRLWAVNDGRRPWRATLELSSYTPEGERHCFKRRPLVVPPGGVWSAAWPGPKEGILRARAGRAEAVLWPERFSVPEPGWRLIEAADGWHLAARRPVPGVWVEEAGEENFVDLFPGETLFLGRPRFPLALWWKGGGPLGLSP